MNGFPYGKDTFADADEKTYRKMEYDCLKHIWNATRQCKSDHDQTLSGFEGRIKKLENRKRWDTSISAGSGLIGGAIAFFMMYWSKFVGK